MREVLSMTDLQQFNFLRDEQSAYLKQHKTNPVNWYPYGPEALQKAKDENKPIFLSIGYSSCHWCHVMGKESFSDPEIADYLNEHFINIKVDKEEYPDIDAYYQLACQIMNGRGGWPLSAFTTPDLKPFFIGTYFPKIASNGSPAFMEILTNLKKNFVEDIETINQNAQQLKDAITQAPTVESKVEFEGHFPGAASVLQALKPHQDDEFGGYGGDPKFPHYAFLEWAVEHMLEGMVPEELSKHVIFTIEQILMGGVYDHAKGGVHRYSVDKKWTVPHFEKMLYDQAGLLKLLAKTSLVYPSPLVYDAMIQTMDYLASEMQSEKGYFFSAQDADSEGMEGLYFSFSREEFLGAIDDFDSELLKEQDKILKWFNITEEGNFEQGLSVISLDPASKDEYYSPGGWDIVRKVKAAILEARKMRIPPATDNKGVASWNFQIITALIDVIQYCKVDSIQQAAAALLQSSNQGIMDTFLYENEHGRTRIHSTTTKVGHVPLVEDYIMFAEYSFRCYEYSSNKSFLANGVGTIDYIFKDFFRDNILYTRALEFSDSAEYENIHTPIFDQSYKSAMGTLIILLRKWATHIPEFKEYLEKMDSSLETLTHLCLQNPLAFGETLRGLVYPDDAYRKIEVPTSWYKNNSFYQFFPNFSVRFALCTHDNDNDHWQICTRTECELNGTTFDEFKKVFTMQDPPVELESDDATKDSSEE
jgi:uncharacterized protein YyaL (SSP411 family)